MIGNKISYDITFIIIQLPHRSLFLLNKMLLSFISVRVYLTSIFVWGEAINSAMFRGKY